MKASLKLREETRQILRAKIPLNILGFQFQSSIETNKKLCLSFSTLFESGPSLKLNYRPKDSSRPFGFALETGIGHFSSVIVAPVTMSAEFSFLGNSGPSFCLHFSSQLDNFWTKRSDSLP